MSEAINIAVEKAEKPKRIKFTFYQKMFFLYFLNITDWICTEALLASGYFAEANPVMQPVLNNFLADNYNQGSNSPCGNSVELLGKQMGERRRQYYNKHNAVCGYFYIYARKSLAYFQFCIALFHILM